MTITVLLADDYALVRNGLREILEMGTDFEVVGEAENGLRAVTLAAQLLPDVVVMDISMPLLNGLEAMRRILQARPAARVLVLSTNDEDVYVERARTLGAAGYLNKATSTHVLAAAIRQAHQGMPFFGPTDLSTATPRTTRIRGDLPGKAAGQLSPMEIRVLRQIAEGDADPAIAAKLRRSVTTVEKHRQSLMDKLKVHTTADLTRHAIAAGIVSSGPEVTLEVT